MLCPIRLKRLAGDIKIAREDYEVCDFTVSVRKNTAVSIIDVRIHEGIHRITSVRVSQSGDSKQRRQQLRKAIRQVEGIIHGTR